nr:hypothetical protein [Nitrosomonas nitrosa]
MKNLVIGLLVSLLCLYFVSDKQQSSQGRSGSILIRRDRPSVYIEFERIGKTPPLFEREKEERIWLRLYNNTPWAINFCSFSVKSKYGDTGIVYEVKRFLTSFGKIEGNSIKDALPEEKKQQEAVKTPQGYSTADVCIPYTLGSRKFVTFSIPREHLGKNLYIEIEYWPEWENIDNELGNFPHYYVSFSSQSLPINER